MHEQGKRAVIYTRVSRDDSGEGASNDRQEKACRDFASARGYVVAGTYSDISVSAYSGRKRPEWERVLELVQAASVDVVLTWSLDRVTRSMRDLEDLIELSKASGVPLVTVNGDLDLSNDQGRMVGRILAAVARGEVERKSARQRLANQTRAAEGVPWKSGFRAFGYELDGSLIPEEAKHVRQAADDALAGVSMREIARQWCELGLRSVHARAGDEKGWTARGIKAMLVNPRYAGIATYKGERIGTGTWQPVFSEETHAELVATLKDPSRRTNKASAGRRPVHLLSTIATCSRCGQHVGGRVSNGKPSYSCQPSNHVNAPRELADAYVLDVFNRAVRAFGPRDLGLTAYAIEPAGGDTIEEIASLEEKSSVLTEAFMGGSIDAETYKSGLARLNARKDEIAASILGDKPTIRSVSEGWQEYLTEFESAPIAARRDAIDRALTITLHPVQGRRNVPVEEQVEVWIKHGSGELIAPRAVLIEATT